MSHNKLRQIQDWPERAQVAKWCAATLAQGCGVSLRTLERHFRKEMGKSPKKWLAKQRLLRANELIQDGSRVKEAAELLDYKHQNNLTNAFVKQWGHSPTDKASQRRAQNP